MTANENGLIAGHNQTVKNANLAGLQNHHTKALPPFASQIVRILNDAETLQRYSGCTRQRATIWIATGPDAYDWRDWHPRHLCLVLPDGLDPSLFCWGFLRGHEPPLILPPVADCPAACQRLAAAILADGVASVLAGSVQFT